MARLNNEGTVDQLPSGSYRARLRLDGKRYGKTFPQAKQALAYLADLRERHAQGRLRGTSRTVGEQLGAWLQSIRGTVEPKTWGEYQKYALHHLIPLLSIPLEALTAEDVRRHLARLQEPPMPIGPRTVRQVRGVLRRAIRQAVEDGLVDRNVVDHTRPPKAPRPVQRVLSRGEQVRLLAEAERRATLRLNQGGDRLAALWWMALRVGGRMAELLGLTWADVDLERGMVAIHRQLEAPEHGRPAWRERAKSTAGVRIVHLPQSVIAALARHRERQDGERLQAGSRWTEYGLVFSTRVGGPLTQGAVRRSWLLACRHADVPALRFHDARHTAASSYIAAGVPIPEVSQILGHSSAAVTSAIYAHAIVRATRSAADALDAFLAADPEVLGHEPGHDEVGMVLSAARSARLPSGRRE